MAVPKITINLVLAGCSQKKISLCCLEIWKNDIPAMLNTGVQGIIDPGDYLGAQGADSLRARLTITKLLIGYLQYVLILSTAMCLLFDW